MIYLKRYIEKMTFTNRFLFISAFCSALILSNSIQSKAQESIMSEFSYLYMEKLIAIAKEKYPRNKILENGIDVAKNNISIAKSSWLDPFSLSYANRSNIYGIEGVSSSSLNGYFFNIAFLPASIIKKPFEVKNAKTKLETANAERDEYSLQLETEVKRRYTLYVQSLHVLKLSNQRLIDAESTYTNMKTSYERSEISFKDFNEASNFFTTAQQAKVAAEADILTSKFQLEELLTVKLEDIK